MAVEKNAKAIVQLLNKPAKEDWLAYIRQVSGPLAGPVTDEYINYINRGYPAEDAAIWALDGFGCLELA